MTESERDDLIDLYVDDALPQSLRARVEEHLAAHPDLAADAASLRVTAARLRAAHEERPDAWFVERALSRLLRENAEGQPSASPASAAGRQ